jgi:hypothetical protein
MSQGLTPEQQKHLDEYLDRMRDEFKMSVYKCSCGFRAFGAPVTMHEAKFKHGQMQRELFPWEKTNGTKDGI